MSECNRNKEVYFDLYCKHCKWVSKPEIEDPCNECLSNPSNGDSHKPVNYEENK